MKFVATLLPFLLGSCLAAPAIVWTNGRDTSSNVVHSSDSIYATEVIADLIGSSESLSAVFLVGRSDDGLEYLSELTSNGSLPGVASKYEEASIVHHHCRGVESTHALSKSESTPLVSLSEFSLFLSDLNPIESVVDVDASGTVSKANKEKSKRARSLAAAKVVIVNVPASTNPADLDSAVVRAIDSGKVGSVMLTGIRSINEVKHERNVETRRRMQVQQSNAKKMSMNSAHRRLADANEDADFTGIYFVNMTPNILAGILFGLLFAVTAFTGISCMGMISGQTVFVSKMPTVGREA